MYLNTFRFYSLPLECFIVSNAADASIDAVDTHMSSLVKRSNQSLAIKSSSKL